ncbi:MAG: exodeoxyribonuclease VII large subunit [Synechococcaceae cyanobacterium SM2_3_60]|nr:exodeoxyribonuclease VII large subunit [Synechococcaceae cyanobacterium SM2_3_60]
MCFGSSRSLNFVPIVGMRLVAEGQLSLYADKSQYQLNCVRLRPAGQGELFLAYEALKAQLQAAGYFAAERKRPLPDRIWRVGVVTSAAGAAIHDIVTTLERRSPLTEVYICPAAVQGENAPQEIAQAIQSLNHQTDCDVAIVGRGGGSLQDLWAFNTESVIEAIYHSRIPVIAAVGHESDSTLADFVADVRAATPTAAAELASPITTDDWQHHLSQLRHALRRTVQQRMADKTAILDHFQPVRAQRHLQQRLDQANQRLDDLDERLQQATTRNLRSYQQQLVALSQHLQALNPNTPLKRGYALLRQRGQYLNAAQAVDPRQPLEIIRSQETLTTTQLSSQSHD